MGEEKNEDLLLKGYKVSVWDDERVLETVIRDGCTTLSIQLMSLNYTLKIVKMTNFMLYIFNHNFLKIMNIV